MRNLDHHTIQISLLEGEVSIQLSKNRSVFFRSNELQNLTYSQFDFALLAAFISSLTTGEKLYFDHPVTNVALRQFDNYSRALRILSPKQFEAPRIMCSNVIVPDVKNNHSNKKILTLSGGIDSTYAASSAMLEDATYTHCLLIKGFDYPLDNTTGFNELRLRVEKIADDLGLQLIVLETNLTDEFSSFGLQHTGALACCLQLMAGAGFESGAYAADFTAMGDVLRAPWGNCMGIASTLTTDRFPIRYLGSERGRTEKIRWLAERKPGLFRYISVCRKEKSIGGNCGKCEKCARTRIGLMAISDPRLRNEIEMSLFGDVSSYRDAFRLNAESLKMARLFDLSVGLPDGEARLLATDEIDKMIANQKRIHGMLKRKRSYTRIARKLVGSGLRKLTPWRLRKEGALQNED